MLSINHLFFRFMLSINHLLFLASRITSFFKIAGCNVALAANLRKKTIGCKFLRDYFLKRSEINQNETK